MANTANSRPNWLAQGFANVGHTFGLPNLGIADWLNGGRYSNPTQNSAGIYPGAAQGASVWNAVPGHNANITPEPGGPMGASVLDASVAPAVNGTAGTGGSTTSTYDPNTDPNLVNQARGMIGGDQNTLNNLYNAINGALTGFAQSARGNVDKQFNTVQNQQDNSYRNNVASSDAAYGARNAYDSSYRGNSDQTMTNAYNLANQSLADQKNNAYAGIGSAIQGYQDQLGEKGQYDQMLQNLGRYNDVNSLTTLHNNLGQYIASLQQSQRDMTPQGALIQKLNSVAPLTSNLDQTLKGQLNGLISANTPTEAQLPLAMAYMQRAGITDPNQQKPYLDYLKQITQPTPTQLNASLAGQ